MLAIQFGKRVASCAEIHIPPVSHFRTRGRPSTQSDPVHEPRTVVDTAGLSVEAAATRLTDAVAPVLQQDARMFARG